MPTKREREYYQLGFRDGLEYKEGRRPEYSVYDMGAKGAPWDIEPRKPRTVKRKLSAWNKYVKANSNKPRFRYKSGAKKGKLNLKKMAVAFRKTPAGKKKRR